MNPGAFFKIKSSWERFCMNHPKFPMFCNAVSQMGIREGTIIEVKITSESGQTLCTNVKLTDSDMELFQTLKDINN